MSYMDLGTSYSSFHPLFSTGQCLLFSCLFCGATTGYKAVAVPFVGWQRPFLEEIDPDLWMFTDSGEASRSKLIFPAIYHECRFHVDTSMVLICQIFLVWQATLVFGSDLGKGEYVITVAGVLFVSSTIFTSVTPCADISKRNLYME
jgi:hypothetical protein